ncbi:hypothetical protein [Pelosinus fermentans]|uniref:Uncharacterized protein n=1 Tax=Pelosinus fermentans JBW45 TaxID=1192197 RepID=I9DCH8_9FIRM|nr:hypothetical protein [Pelosinus fermentans]AJQ26926.1 hypothetical protein JBW_01576 [Pelosinus fermentans JBW45]
MAYSKVTINNPNEFLLALRAFAVANGWTTLVEADDLPIDGTATTDGKRLVMKSPSGETYAHFRAANGKKIFNTHTTAGHMYGVGLTCSAGFTEIPASGKWYDQPGVTKSASSEVIGVGIPLHTGIACDVYFNHIAAPAELIIASVELYPGLFQHIAVGELQKIGSWTGGTIYSASCSSSKMFPTALAQGTIEATCGHLFGVNTDANTFLRANIDAAPLRTPEVLWAGCAPAAGFGYTGKRIALSVVNRNALTTVPKIPHYGYLQSQSATDYGRNVNTLNCISVNLPIAVYVLRDPDGLENYSQCGYIPGVYCISTRNVAPGSIYSVDYPSSGVNYQALPQTKRGGTLGYDGLAIKQ